MQAPRDLIDKYKDRVGPGIKNHVYAAMIEGMDRSIGRVLDKVDSLGRVALLGEESVEALVRDEAILLPGCDQPAKALLHRNAFL